MSQVLEAHGLTFVVDDPIERWRVETLETKEPGTIQWLEETLRPGDVFYDIGANIGIYTVLASSLVGPTGHVYAFEPHIINAASLLRNVAPLGNVSVLTCALHEVCGVKRFNYASLRAGSSGSQLGHQQREDGGTFDPAVVELKHATTLHTLQWQGQIKPADVVKIDVDGNEPQVLAGLLAGSSARWPRAIQVEVHPEDRQGIHARLDHGGYRVELVHYTASGQKHIDHGVDPDAVINNTVFVR